LGNLHRKTGGIAWLCLCIAFALTGTGYMHGLKQYKHEELPRLSLTQNAWQIGWFFVDVTGTGTKCFVVDGNTAQRQRNLQRTDMFFVALGSANGFETSSRLSLTPWGSRPIVCLRLCRSLVALRKETPPAGRVFCDDCPREVIGSLVSVVEARTRNRL